MPGEQQIGLIEDGVMVREPELCAVTGRPIRGKHAVTQYGPNGQFVYILSQAYGDWPQVAPEYGFPVPEEKSVQAENVFVLGDKSSEQGVLTVTDSSGKVTEINFPAPAAPAQSGSKKPKSWGEVLPLTDSPKEGQ